MSTAKPSEVAVVGAGVIGLAIAWRCLQRGLTVTVFDPEPGSGATPVAAGMLSPVTELHYGEEALMRLGCASAARYPSFVAELSAEAGIDVGYRPTGTLAVAWDTTDFAALRDLHAFQQSLGLSTDLITAAQVRELEPALVPGLAGGLFAPDDHQVDNRALHRALLAAVVAAGGRIEPAAVSALARDDDRVTGVIDDSGKTWAADVVVAATGAWLSRLLPAVNVRPVKGQTVRLRAEAGLLTHVLRADVKGTHVYLVPRADGTIVIGASCEEAGFDLRPRAGVVYELLRDAQSVLPQLSEAELLDVGTGLRPGSPDNAPLIGWLGDGLIVASGHYRNGILLTPITADVVAALVAGESTEAAYGAADPAAFDPRRFNTAAAARGSR